MDCLFLQGRDWTLPRVYMYPWIGDVGMYALRTYPNYVHRAMVSDKAVVI